MNQAEKLYLLLDSRDAPLARGVLESAPDAPNWQVRVLDGRAEAAAGAGDVHMIGMSSALPALAGRVIRCCGDRIVLEKRGDLGAAARENLRMPVSFRSFIYPLDGGWRGRREIESCDLSCGGVAFYCDESLEDGEELEIVIPITSQPLVLRCRILRRRMSPAAQTLYAGRFVDLCHDEEAMVREAVFGVQLSRRSR